MNTLHFLLLEGFDSGGPGEVPPELTGFVPMW
jgi:hypothetical protein